MRSRIAVFGLLSMAVLSGPVDAKDLRMVGVTVGSLGNPFFVTLGKGAEAAAR